MEASGVMTNLLLIVFTLAVAQAAPTNDKQSELRFKTAISNLEIVQDGYFVQLNCFAENFKQVQWFKDGRPFPDWSYLSWLSGWVELRHNNQSLMIAKAPKDAGGVYTCVASDDAKKISKDITLRVVDAPYQGPALILQGKGCTDMSASIGDNVTFYCEVYAGSSNLFANVFWTFRNGDDASMKPSFVLPNVRREISFEDNILGSFLHVTNVTEASYGQYMLSASLMGEKTSAILHLRKREPNCH